MADADRRVKQLRRRMADWGPAAGELGEAAKGFDARFREAIAEDLGLPAAVVIVNELDRETEIPGGEKYALLASWDRVLGLDLERDAHSTWEPTPAMSDLIALRDEAREAKDYATSDDLRERLSALGLEVMDTPEGTKVRPLDP